MISLAVETSGQQGLERPLVVAQPVRCVHKRHTVTVRTDLFEDRNGNLFRKLREFIY